MGIRKAFFHFDFFFDTNPIIMVDTWSKLNSSCTLPLIIWLSPHLSLGTDNTKQPHPSKFGKWYLNSFIFWQDNCCLTNTVSAWAWAPTPEGLRSINKDESWSRSSHRRKTWRHLHTVWVLISRRCDWHKLRFVPVVAVLWWTYVYYVGICIYF